MHSYAEGLQALFILFQESELILRLEMVACDGNCASLRPSEVALVLLCTYLDAAVNRLNANADADSPALHNAPAITSSYQMLKDELMQFAVGLREKCNVNFISLLIHIFKFYYLS